MGKRNARPHKHLAQPRHLNAQPAVSPLVKWSAAATVVVAAVAVPLALSRSDEQPAALTTAEEPTPRRTIVLPIESAISPEPTHIVDPFAKDSGLLGRATTTPSTTPPESDSGAVLPQISATSVTSVAPETTPVPTTTPPPPTETATIEAPIIEEADTLPVEVIESLPTGVVCVVPPGNYDGVVPFVGVVGAHLQQKFGVQTIGGKAGRGRFSDHPDGYALDFMIATPDPTIPDVDGDALAQYVLDRRDALDVAYVIWKQRINHGNGWVDMEDRGNDTENHFDHVHVSFERSGDAAPTCG